MKKTKKLFSVLLGLALVLMFIPTIAFADTEDPGVAIVTISNTTFETGEWTGELFTTMVEIDSTMTLGDAVKAACDDMGVSILGATVAEGSYITDIDGLSFGDAGGWSGWTLSVNNWFSSVGASAAVEDGDWISIQYSVDGMGADLGSIFSPIEDANNKTLQALEFDSGELDPAFSPEEHDYTLTLPAGTEELFVLPMAFNLNYQVQTSVDGIVYKLMDGVPVSEGTVITVVCGDPSWPSMNNGQDGTGAENVPAETYTITIAYAEDADDGDNGEVEVISQVDDSPKTGNFDFGVYAFMIMVASSVGMVFVARRKTN